MTAPIDIECPACAATPGNYCTVATTPRQRVTFHHAERVDAACRENTRRPHDPRALRSALIEALNRLEKHHPAIQDALTDELSFILTTRERFGL